MVRDWRAHDGTRAIVHRPGIVVGDSKTGYTTHYHGFYGLPRVMEICIDRFGDMGMIRFPAMPEKKVNLVPINYVVQAMRVVIEAGRHFGKTFHLTNPNPPTLVELAEAMGRVFGKSGPRFCSMTQFLLKPPSSEERFAVKMVERYAPYLRFPEAEFDQTNILEATASDPVDSPYLSGEQIERLIEEAKTPADIHPVA
jgi:nucleoside-diphosphate-sugar epimerase